MTRYFDAFYWNLLTNKAYYTSVLARYILGGYTVHCRVGGNWCEGACRGVARQMSAQLTALRVMNTCEVKSERVPHLGSAFYKYTIVIKAA